MIELKRVDLLITAIARLQKSEVELVVIGSGPLERELRTAAEAALPDRVVWVWEFAAWRCSREVAKADCLVLPSRYDGWGAVVSEALMVGTPVICSDRCGSAGVVRSSGYGGVFSSGDLGALACELQRVVSQGHLSVEARLRLAEWGSAWERVRALATCGEYSTMRMAVWKGLRHRGWRPILPLRLGSGLEGEQLVENKCASISRPRPTFKCFLLETVIICECTMALPYHGFSPSELCRSGYTQSR
ncbi:MAG: glycosyltransferase [Betaproteobacteria bacterium]|nr:glycosyltransferase [Betaproteobacteria bacterium]